MAAVLVVAGSFLMRTTAVTCSEGEFAGTKERLRKGRRRRGVPGWKGNDCAGRRNKRPSPAREKRRRDPVAGKAVSRQQFTQG